MSLRVLTADVTVAAAASGAIVRDTNGYGGVTVTETAGVSGATGTNWSLFSTTWKKGQMLDVQPGSALEGMIGTNNLRAAVATDFVGREGTSN